MKPGDIRRWKEPWQMPPFRGGELLLIVRVEDYTVDYIVNGELVRGWRIEYILENSEPVNEIG